MYYIISEKEETEMLSSWIMALRFVVESDENECDNFCEPEFNQ
jgi:hypothetical protein